jgi:hypothetical protein
MQPVDVDERCEFLSAEWIATAAVYLRGVVRAEPALQSVGVSLCEAFEQAPPSVADSDGRAAWHFSLDAGRVDVGQGVTPSDVHVSGRYQVALGYAQVVHAAGAESVARCHRELAHQFGANALTIDGDLPSNPAVTALLSGLHDHMTARTVDNPNFEHHVRELGITGAVEQLTEQGYAVIGNAISPEFADELCSLAADEVTAHHPLTTNGLMMRDRRFEELALHGRVCALAQSVVGQGMILGAMSATFKKPGPGAIPLHADYPLVRSPYPEFGLIAVAVWAFQDWLSEDVGPTWVVPGSHRHHRPPTKDDDVGGAGPILMPKGSVLIMGHGVWHWQGDRTASDARVAAHVTYNRVFVRQLDDFSRVDKSFYARNPPAFSTLMGQDDPFGKSSYQGHDGKRFAYAGRFVQT